MDSNHIERVIRTSRRFFLGHGAPNEWYANPAIARALQLLTTEFLDALATGPDTLVSMPDTARERQAHLITVMRAIFVEPPAWRELLEEIQHVDGNPTLKLAEMYAAWVVKAYAKQGAFDGIAA
jgi:hypothetical protein